MAAKKQTAGAVTITAPDIRLVPVRIQGTAPYVQNKFSLDDGSPGIPASAFRAAMIDACRLVGFKMTEAKMSVFVQADGFDADDGTPLVRFSGGEPEMTQFTVRNATGVADVRVRPMWRRWEAILRIQYDADQFKEADVLNLLLRAGLQVGVGEGRPFSKKSAGMGWGTFTIVSLEAA
jgi:hypothetical protein